MLKLALQAVVRNIMKINITTNIRSLVMRDDEQLDLTH